MLTVLEICAGAGGQALGLEMAGFKSVALVEIDKDACETLRTNRPEWNVFQGDVKLFQGGQFAGVDLLAGGVPCPPYSIAGKQLGSKDERDLFPEAIRLVRETEPKAILLENVKGLLHRSFAPWRKQIATELDQLGYNCGWRLLNANDYGVSQLRPRAVLVGFQKGLSSHFEWPVPNTTKAPTVGELLYDLMVADGWKGAEEWKSKANAIAPTLVGGSKRHGGPDLGPTRARHAWASLGVDGRGLWNAPPPQEFEGHPRLTTKMAARIQGFPDSWVFTGKKTSTYRQIGNAFPPPVANSLGTSIASVLKGDSNTIFRKTA